MGKKKQRRLRYDKLAKQSAIKKEVAYFVAKYTAHTHDPDAPSYIDVLAKGHRGFLSYDEKGLVKLFEKAYDALEAKRNAYLEEKQKAEASGTGRYWDREPTEDKTLFSEAEKLMRDLMENIVLGDGKF